MSLTGVITVDQLQIVETDADPRVSPGVVAALGSIALNQAVPYTPLVKNGTSAQAWTPIASVNEYYNVNSTAVVSTTATTYAIISGMTYTPPAGTYIVLFNGTINVNGATPAGSINLFNGTTASTTGTRLVTVSIALGGALSVSSIGVTNSTTTFDVMTFDGVTACTAQFACSSGTVTISNRSLHLLRLG